MDDAPSNAAEMEAFLEHVGGATLNVPSGVEDLLRELAPQVLGALARRIGDFDAAEDAVQEALIAAADHWPRDGHPARTRAAGCSRTAGRRLIDQRRSEQSRRQPRALDRRAGGVSRRGRSRPRRTTPWSCCSCAATRR